MREHTHDQSTGEIWKPIPGWGERYEASDLGRIRSLPFLRHNGHRFYTQQGRILGQSSNVRNEYMHVMFRLDGKSYCKSVHRLVLEAFVGPCPDGMEACHNNGDRTDNRLANLRWDSSKANKADMKKHGTVYQYSKTHCPSGHAYSGKNLVVFPAEGIRRCRACSRADSYLGDHPEMREDRKKIADQYYEKILKEE